MTLGEYLRQVRAGRGLSLRQLAKLVDGDHAYIWELEQDNKAPTEEYLSRLLRALGVRGRVVVKTTVYVGTAEGVELKAAER